MNRLAKEIKDQIISKWQWEKKEIFITILTNGIGTKYDFEKSEVAWNHFGKLQQIQVQNTTQR